MGQGGILLAAPPVMPNAKKSSKSESKTSKTPAKKGSAGAERESEPTLMPPGIGEDAKVEQGRTHGAATVTNDTETVVSPGGTSLDENEEDEDEDEGDAPAPTGR